MKENRYQSIPGQKGIRKDLKSGKYEAYKKINGKRFSQYFDKISEAKAWRLTFVPTEEKIAEKSLALKDLIEYYVENHVSKLATSTRLVRLDRLKIFKELESTKVESITPDLLSRFFTRKAKEAVEAKSKRMNFHQEIADLNAIFNYYKENFNYRFFNPVTKGLKASSVIKKNAKAKEKMSAEEFLTFFNALDPYYQDVCLVQSRLAARISEVAGLQVGSIDFKKGKIVVKDVVVWGRKKEFVELKTNPKSGEIRECFITPDLETVLKRHLKNRFQGSGYVFHVNGKPLSYRSIQHAYDHALKKVGLYGRFSGTHIIRHFTAGITRLVCGNVDAVQAVTGHKSVRLAEHYSGLPSQIQSKAITQVEDYLNGLDVQRCAGGF